MTCIDQLRSRCWITLGVTSFTTLKWTLQSLAHLQMFNDSKEFWSLFSDTCNKGNRMPLPYFESSFLLLPSTKYLYNRYDALYPWIKCPSLPNSWFQFLSWSIKHTRKDLSGCNIYLCLNALDVAIESVLLFNHVLRISWLLTFTLPYCTSEDICMLLF